MKRVFLLLFIFSSFLFSITMYPLIETISNLKKRQIVFKVSNPTERTVAADFSIKFLVDTNGKKEKRIETQKVMAYPSQFVLKPKESKKIRVRYMGSVLPDVEEVYRIIAHELNIDVSDKMQKTTTNKVEGQIKMRFTYEGLLFVHKPKAKANLKIKTFEILDTNSIKLTINNIGQASIVPNYNFYNFIIIIDNKEYLLTEKNLKDTKFKRILAGKENILILKNIKLPQGKLNTVRLEKKDKK